MVKRKRSTSGVATLRPAQQWRVSWRRSSWATATSSKSRIFHRRSDARKFVRRLRSDDRPDLAPISVTVEVRDIMVGKWLELQLRERKPRTPVLHVMPALPDDVHPALKEAIARRRVASTTGKCPCGAAMLLDAPITPGAIVHGVMEHEPGCNATDEAIDALIARHGWPA